MTAMTEAFGRNVKRILPLVASLPFFATGAVAGDANWPSFRGRRACGVADGASPPVTWNIEKGTNVAWKTEIAGLGHSSPVIWQDRVFVTSAVSGHADSLLKVGLYGDIVPVADASSNRFVVTCVNRTTGDIVWQQTAIEAVPKIKRHPKSTHANSTPATDGTHVVAFFGSEGLYCYDMNGKLLWKKDLGVLDSGYYQVPMAQWGFGSSPIIHDGRVIVQCDVQKDSFLAAFDLKTGKQIWRRPRTELPTWSTPTIVDVAGQTQIVVNGYNHIGGYEFDTGQPVWQLHGGGDIPVPTPISGLDLIFITNAHGSMAPIYAVRTTAKGDISLAKDTSTNEHIAWSYERSGDYMQTPILVGDYLYRCRDNGVVSCYDARTGKANYTTRLGGGRTGFTASPVAVSDRLYFTSEDGDVFVVATGPQFRQLAENQMNEVCMATPAISGNMLIFRTQHHLIALAQ